MVIVFYQEEPRDGGRRKVDHAFSVCHLILVQVESRALGWERMDLLEKAQLLPSTLEISLGTCAWH